MQRRRFDTILTGTAIALVFGLTVGGSPAFAQALSNAAIEAKIPLPEPANLPPPTAADVAPAEATASTGTAINLPDPQAAPPPPLTDVAAPVRGAAPASAPAPAAAAPAATPEPVKVAAP